MDDTQKPLTKPVLLIAGFMVLLIASAFVPAKWIGLKQARKEAPIDFSKIKSNEVVAKELDTDNDGLLTWKEMVVATAGESSDLLKGSPTTDKRLDKAIDDPNNLTASFAKNFVVSTAYLKSNNITDKETSDAVLNEIVQAEAAKVTSKKYIYADLHIAKTEDRVSIRAYGNQLGSLIGTLVTEKNILQDLPGVASYLDNGNEKVLEPIIQDSARVNKIFGKLLAMNVPPSAAAYHLALLNQVTLYNDTLSNLSGVVLDPMRASIAMKQYAPILMDTLRLYKNFESYFNLKNIAFLPQESGYVFTKGFSLEAQ